MSLQPASFEEAKLKHKPMKRGTIARQAPLVSHKPVSLSRGKKTAQKATKRKKRPRKLSDGKLKKKVWTQFSIFIRTRGADEQGFNRCVTCLVKKHWKELQAGHFIRGRLNANLFDERGTQPQCYICNVHFQGNVVIYYGWMRAKFGQEVIDELIEQNNQTRKWQAGELQSLLEHYTALNAQNPLLSES